MCFLTHWEKRIFCLYHLTLRQHLTLVHRRCLPPHHGNQQKPDCTSHAGSAVRTTGSALAPAARLQIIPGSYCTLWNGPKYAACLLLNKSWGQTAGHTKGWTFEDKVCATVLAQSLGPNISHHCHALPVYSSTCHTVCNISWKVWLTNNSRLKNRGPKSVHIIILDMNYQWQKPKCLFVLLHVNS